MKHEDNMICELCGREDKAEDFVVCSNCERDICESCVESCSRDHVCVDCLDDIISAMKPYDMFEEAVHHFDEAVDIPAHAEIPREYFDNLPTLVMTPSHFMVDEDGIPQYQYTCGNCGNGISSWASKCCRNDV